MIQGVTQIVIAVNDLEEAITSYEALGFHLTRRSTNANLGINQAFVHMGDGTEIELAQPFDANSAVGRGLERKGEDMYMLSVAVDDVQATATEMKANGLRLGSAAAGGTRSAAGAPTPCADRVTARGGKSAVEMLIRLPMPNVKERRRC